MPIQPSSVLLNILSQAATQSVLSLSSTCWGSARGPTCSPTPSPLPWWAAPPRLWSCCSHLMRLHRAWRPKPWGAFILWSSQGHLQFYKKKKKKNWKVNFFMHIMSIFWPCQHHSFESGPTPQVPWGKKIIFQGTDKPLIEQTSLWPNR